MAYLLVTVSNEIEQVALRAARAAGRIHLKRLSRITVNRKSNSIDLVTEADRESEAAVIETIHRAFPTHAILAEESGASAHLSDHRWIIDPLDGTTNFAHGYPQFCVSIAYERRGKVHARRHLRRAQKGMLHRAARPRRDAQRQADPRQHHGQPVGALLSTGFPYDRRERRRYYLCFWEELMTRVQGVRRTGAAALDLAYVACGRTDGFWEFGLKPWDVAAGALLVEEARGRREQHGRRELDLAGANIVATNGRIQAEMIETLAASAAGSRTPPRRDDPLTRQSASN